MHNQNIADTGVKYVNLTGATSIAANFNSANVPLGMAPGAKFCQATFTITELRRVYEILWGKRLDPGNFQRNLRANQAFLSDIGSQRTVSPSGGRPASLWRLADPTGKGRLETPLASRTSAPQ